MTNSQLRQTINNHNHSNINNNHSNINNNHSNINNNHSNINNNHSNINNNNNNHSNVNNSNNMSGSQIMQNGISFNKSQIKGGYLNGSQLNGNQLNNNQLNNNQFSLNQFNPNQIQFLKNNKDNINIGKLIGQIKKEESEKQLEKLQRVSKTNFEFQNVIGKGGFGKVWRVINRKSKKLYAMKELSKAKVLSKKSIHSVMNERGLLTHIKHPFIVNMQSAFQDRENLYLVMDYLPGGDLRYHVGKMRRFNEIQTKFFCACLVLGLQHLHKNEIIHRDIKPENLVLDRKGYTRITDLGIARRMKKENSQDTSGTPGYMAPEVMCRQNHSFEVDFFAMGVILYEFMMGRRPYYGRNRREIRDQILQKQVQVKKKDIPQGWSDQSVDLCNRLLQRKPDNRIGSKGIDDIMNHEWFKNVDWQKLEDKQISAPYLPTSKDNNFDPTQLETTEEDLEEHKVLLKKGSVQNLFAGYYFEQEAAMKTGTLISTNLTNQYSNC